jgi:hypothetical protein
MAASPLTNPSLAGCVCGVLAAVFLFELGLRPFVGGGNRSADRIRTIRSYTEGFANAHFEPDGLGTYGNRLTGNPVLAGAPELVVLGDSHVIAQAVRDEETMGAVIERLSRAQGHPLNVRQYGWSSANAPTFLAVAPSLLKARHPSWVVVVLNAANIGVNALTTRQNWRMEMAPDGSVRLIDMRPGPPTRWQRTRQEIGRSSLALAVWRRIGQIQNRAGAFEDFNGSINRSSSDAQLAQEAARVPGLTVRGLQQAYGSGLMVVYAPMFSGTHYDLADPMEQELLGLCAENGVWCLSMRDPLARSRYENLRLSRGFHNTAPGEGHFNATVHEIIGREIWRYLSTRLPSN